MGNTVLNETQEERDIELSKYSSIPLKSLKKLKIGTQKSIKLYKNMDIDRDSYSFIYKDYKYLYDVDYLRTLAAFTVTRRARYIYMLEKVFGCLENKNILDFGCGVGSHGIYCLQKRANVDFLDVDGPLYSYAKWRIKNRKLKNVKYLDEKEDLISNKYDAVICLDVLEHVAKPIFEINRITKSIKKGGLLLLEVSTMIKPTSGHFSKTINIWKKNGDTFLNKHYIKIKNNLYKRNR